jgi:signal transduction histidine kinase
MNALVHLAGEVSHELNNIFTAVTGNLSLLSEQVQVDDHAGMIAEISRTAERGIALSQKLQAFAGRQPLKRKSSDVSRLVGTVLEELRFTLPAGIRLSPLPETAGCICYVDEDKLRDTLRELAANAVAAMQGRGDLRFEVAEMQVPAGNLLKLRPGLYARIQVFDTGHGMAPETVARALDPLFSTKAAHIDSGWGLSNCAGFLRQSGGCMYLRSNSGTGTVVELYLPLTAIPERVAQR